MVVPNNDKWYERITVLKTVVEGLSRSLNFDPSPENLVKLPPVAAPTPIPDWAKKEAKEYGIKV
ncbi:MAG: hypothetical protein KDJ52_16775 [Anaerolineae bacterium]|nr:hypothetical protein [Anaerolineae bacterium]